MKRISFAVIATLALTAIAVQAVEQKAFSGAGVIESRNGGFMFPDGSVQESANNPSCAPVGTPPVTIDTPGVYCLDKNLAYDGAGGIPAILIDADNVSLDLMGWTLDGSAGGSSITGQGIHAYQRKNLTIRNGTIRGFNICIDLGDAPTDFNVSHGHKIMDVRVAECTHIGINVAGIGNLIHGNQVIKTGLGTDGAPGAIGIAVNGKGARVLDNEIVEVTAPDCCGGSSAYGLFLHYAQDSVVEGNRIASVWTEGQGEGTAIHIQELSNILVTGNRITSADRGVNFIISTGKYRDNITENITTATYTGGTDLGNND